MTKSEWRNDPDAEAVLQYVGVESELREVCLEEVDWVASANNCARLQDPLNQQKIDEYEAAMRRGDRFPRVVVEDSKKGYVILGGNQRCNAQKQIDPKAVVGAYCVSPLTEGHREAIIRSLNSRHGWGMDRAERLDHGVHLVRKFGFSADDAAHLMQVSPNRINARIRAENTRAELAKSGINSNPMSLVQLEEIGKINDDYLRKQVAKEVEQHSPSGEDTRNAVRAILSQRDKASRVKLLREWKAELGSRQELKKKRGKISLPRRDKMLRHLTTFSDFLERGNDGTGFSSLDELSMSEVQDGDKVRALAAKIIIRLEVITGAKP